MIVIKVNVFMLIDDLPLIISCYLKEFSYNSTQHSASMRKVFHK